ncbi:uncharacterized protein NECHADRAFT_74980 [Fusarium vanettenii 77-13-4]|uniref:Apple domain-containing protein n=1 Tax=Fusarium vanettenii (strain ATCC MYA-4622 / CBS 123669 / FGSC 9596 / NRRL 45880 / 77-13-4) TaxID=660122 RepID=C7YHI2_FUSV7|nr:uncharacterized protein NECHADRAFT_74980 [Fusarium vanettenii 77-13-4]EEU48643.1 hypothetical protein NECHADRAFT_74980 [Fusarium vanettenii 77-13-4]
MLLPTFIGAAGLLATAVEAAPRGTWFNKLRRDDQGSQGSTARMAARADYNYANAYNQPNVYTPGAKYASPDTYTKVDSQYAAPKNTSTSAVNSKTLKSDIECPTGGVYVSTTTLDLTVTVTASSNMSYTICRDCTQTVTRNGTVYLPGGKYVPTLSYDKETNAAYPIAENTNRGGEYNTGSPYYPTNATYLPPKTKDVEDPDETEPCTDDFPYMNSTIAAPMYTTPVSASGYQSAIYNTPSGYNSDAPVYTRPAYVKPVYPEPGHSNSSIETPAYTKPVYTKPVYPRPSGSGNSTIVAPVYTKPVYPDPSGNSSVVPTVYTPPVYTKPVYPGPSGNSSTPPAYVKPVYTKPVYPEPNNSSIVPTVYTPPVYTKPAYTKPVLPGNSTATSPVYTNSADPSVYTPPAYTKPVVPGNSSTASTKSADPSVYTPPVYTKPVYPQPVNSSTGEAPVYTPPAYSNPVVPNNSSTVPPVYTTPVDPSVYTPPTYTKPAYSEPIIPGNSSTSEDPIYTPPVNTQPAYPGSVVSSSSSTNEGPVYTPPAYTRPVYSDPVASGNSSVTPPATTKPVDTPVYSPPVYTKPVFPSESSDAYPLPSTPSNSTIPPVLPVSSSDSSSSVEPTFTPEASTSQGSSASVSTAFDPESTSIEPTTLPVTPFLTTTTSIESSTTEPCIIDTSMVPISSSYLNTTATTPSVPTETICEDDAENGAPKSNTAYCGVNGKATGMNFLAEFSEDSYGMPVTLEGCYQFCKLDLPSTRGCEAYRFYENDSGATRCAVYGQPVYKDIREIDSTVEDVWFDLSCGSPSQYQDSTSTDNQSSGIGASIKLSLGLKY